MAAYTKKWFIEKPDNKKPDADITHDLDQPQHYFVKFKSCLLLTSKPYPLPQQPTL